MIFRHFKQLYPKERNQTADLLKGFAVLCMIQVHLMELFASQEIYDSWLGKISLFLGGPPAAPLFMAVMGYFLASSQRSFSQNLKRGFYLIIGGILLNIGLSLHLIILYLFGKVQIDPLRYILGADILPLAGLSVILISTIKKISKINFYVSVSISFLIFILILITHGLTQNSNFDYGWFKYFQPFLWGNLEWSYFPFLPWAVYPLSGYLFRILAEQIKPEESTKNFFALVSAVITYTTFNYGLAVGSDLHVYYHHDWIYTLWIFQFLILISYVFHKLEGLMDKNNILIYIKWIGKNVTAVYVFQWLLIGNIATIVYKTQSVISLVVWFVAIVFLVTILTHVFEQRIKKFEGIAA